MRYWAVVIVMFSGWCCCTRSDSFEGQVAQTAGASALEWREAFAGTMAGRPLRRRMDTARRLAMAEGAEEWVVLLLADPLCMYSGSPASHEAGAKGITDLDRAVIGELLKGLRCRATGGVLWATTKWLREDRAGHYPTSSDVIPGVYGALETSTTGPLKDVARAALRRALRVDYGYDMVKWRSAILKGRYLQPGQH